MVMAAVLAGGCGDAAPVDEVQGAEQPFATGLGGEPAHEEMTADGLYFLRPEIVAALQAFNVATDVESVLDSRAHFDDCNFSNAAQLVRAHQSEAVAALDPAAPPVESEIVALRAFARSLHAIQDFYSHTNWVELGMTEIVDRSLGTWPTFVPYAPIGSSGVVVVEGSPPRRTAVTRPSDLPYPDNAVVRVRVRATVAPGLISGSVDYEPGDSCPRQVRMTHDELNKDSSTNPGRMLQHEQAKALGIEQTTHEWCRLSALTQAAWGDAGVERLTAWLAPGAAAPDCSAGN